MASSPRTAEREEERRINLRTLLIASVAAASAAAVTSQLWIAGTWVAAALTPVIVTFVSEALHRPTARIARAWTSERPAVSEETALPDAGGAGPPPPSTADRLPARAPAEPGSGREPPLQPRVEQPPGGLGPGPPGAAGPVRVYRQPASRPRRRKIALGVVAATTAIAFVFAVVVLTVPELIAGGSIGKGDRGTTLFGGKPRHAKSNREETTPTEQQEKTTPQETTTTPAKPPAQRSAPEQPSTKPPAEEEPTPTETVPTAPQTQTSPQP